MQNMFLGFQPKRRTLLFTGEYYLMIKRQTGVGRTEDGDKNFLKDEGHNKYKRYVRNWKNTFGTETSTYFMIFIGKTNLLKKIILLENEYNQHHMLNILNSI